MTLTSSDGVALDSSGEVWWAKYRYWIGWSLLGLTFILLGALLTMMLIMAKPDDQCFTKPQNLANNVSAIVTSGDMHIGGAVCIAIRAPTQSLKSSAKADVSRLPTERNWTLVVNGAALATAVQPMNVAVGQPMVLKFRIPNPEDAADPDARILRSIWVSNRMISGSYRGDRPAVFSVSARATADFEAILSLAGAATLRIHYTSILATGLMLLITFVAGVVWLCGNSGLIKDNGANAFSLARAQMTFWFVLTASAFLYIWLTTGQWQHVVSEGTLALLGISSATGLFATAIVRPETDAAATGNWFVQLLSDNPQASLGTIGLHRVIMLVWTLFLGAIFVNKALFSYDFAQFDVPLLILSGIVGGVYVGFKKLA